MSEEKLPITPIQAVEILETCFYQHYRRFLIPGLINSFNEIGILGALAQGDEFSCQRNLTKIMGTSRTSITLLMNDMEERNLVSRISNDKRKHEKNVLLTQKSKDILSWQSDRKKRYEDIMYAGISKEELELHSKITMKMLENLLDASERELNSMPSFDEFSKGGDFIIPKIMSHENQKAFVKMVKTVNDIENEKEK